MFVISLHNSVDVDHAVHGNTSIVAVVLGTMDVDYHVVVTSQVEITRK